MMPDWLKFLDFVCIDIAFTCATAAVCVRQHLAEKRRRDELLEIEATLRGHGQSPDDYCTCGEKRSSHQNGRGQAISKLGELCVGFQDADGAGL